MDYSDGNFSAMQQEAINRVREMQKRSRSIVNEAASPPPAFNEQNSNTNANGNPQNIKQGQPPLSSFLGGLLGGKQHSEKGELFSLGGIKIDEEKAMIGLLIYILYKQNADIKLLLGLGYLLL